MQLKIMKMDKLFITGFSGDGRRTGELWCEFDKPYKENPFPKKDDFGYEIRFRNRVGEGNDIHVDINTETEYESDNFTSQIPHLLHCLKH